MNCAACVMASEREQWQPALTIIEGLALCHVHLSSAATYAYHGYTRWLAELRTGQQ